MLPRQEAAAPGHVTQHGMRMAEGLEGGGLMGWICWLVGNERHHNALVLAGQRNHEDTKCVCRVEWKRGEGRGGRRGKRKESRYIRGKNIRK